MYKIEDKILFKHSENRMKQEGDVKSSLKHIDENKNLFALLYERFNWMNNFIKDDETVWEKEPLENLANDKQLAVFKHEGFWKAMDTMRDKEQLEKLNKNSQAPWIVW